MSGRKFGWMQVITLEKIAAQTEKVVDEGRGEALYKMLDLEGKAKSYAGRYVDSLRSAVERHNAGTCPDNCPVPMAAYIVWGNVGPHGGQGYYVLPRKIIKKVG